jgi:hypothetical protein
VLRQRAAIQARRVIDDEQLARKLSS